MSNCFQHFFSINIFSKVCNCHEKQMQENNSYSRTMFCQNLVRSINVEVQTKWRKVTKKWLLNLLKYSNVKVNIFWLIRNVFLFLFSWKFFVCLFVLYSRSQRRHAKAAQNINKANKQTNRQTDRQVDKINKYFR